MRLRLHTDPENRFREFFDPITGLYLRSGILDDEGRDTGVDPFMRRFPALIDIGIMNHCACASRCNVDCYQKAISRTGPDMSLPDYISILRQCEGLVYQVALGGAGDPDTHENFEDILRITRGYGIVPNFTTSGICLTRRTAELCREYAGAVAVSEHDAPYTRRALELLLACGVKTNVHFVLSNQSIDAAICRLKDNYYAACNAVVFLLYKPVGLGRPEKVLRSDDHRLVEFFDVIQSRPFTHKVGFDSCSAPALINRTTQVDLLSIDYCEAARYSMYIDADLNAMPCSFGNHNPALFVSLRDHTIREAWEGEVFSAFRSSLQSACPSCPSRGLCAGGCPICRQIVLCDRPERFFPDPRPA